MTLRAARDAPDTATALVNATTNIGIAGGALVGSRLLGVVALPDLGWVGAAFAAASVAVYAAFGRHRTNARSAQPVAAGRAHLDDRRCDQH